MEQISPWIWGLLVLSVISPVFYTKSILAGQAKPHRVTRLVVWLAAIAGLLGVLDSTNLAGIIFAAIFFTRATYLLVLSILRGVGGATRLDRTCLVVAILGLIMYWISGNGLIAITFGILADLIGYIPTFVKTWHQPKSEDPLFFGIEGLAALCAMFAIGEWRLDILFPLYFVVCCVIVLFLIYRPRLKNLAARAAGITDTPQV